MARIAPGHSGFPRVLSLFLLTGFLILAAQPSGLFKLLQPAAHAATVFTVNSTGDGSDSNPSDGVCDDGAGNCTLRAAIQQANATPGADTINFSVTGTINLTGALPVLSTDMTINGPGANLLTVRRDTGGDYRIFTVPSGATVNISGLTVANGRTPDGQGAFSDAGNGGGIFNAGTLSITGASVSGNLTGNGIFIDSSTAFWRGGDGGGIANTGTLSLTGVTVSGNHTGTSDRFSLAGSRPSGGVGGGIFNSGALTLTNSTISGNQTGVGIIGGAPTGDAGTGGAIANVGSLTIISSTLTANSAGSDMSTFGLSGGIDSKPLFYLPPGTATSRNSIIAGNVPNDTNGPLNSQGNNIIQKSLDGPFSGAPTDIIGKDPKLGPLADNGGPTFTHALLAGSPALDAGDAISNTLTTDQRGVGRLAGASVDIGAYEFHPTAEDVSDKTGFEDTLLPVAIAIGDGATDITSLSASSDNQTLVPDSGLQITGTGPVRTLKITPAANQNGMAHITLTENKSGGGSATDSFLLTVMPINDPPTFTKGTDVSVAEDSGPQVIPNWAAALSAGPPDESGQSLTFNVTGNTNPSLFSTAPAVSPSGALTFTSAPNANGSATVTLVLKDDGGTANGGQDTSAAQTFKITVTPVNDPPAANDQTVTTLEDSAKAITLTGSDVDGDALTFNVASGPSHGSLSGSGSSRTYTPAPDFNGSDSFTFKAVDTSGAESAPATVSINVTPVNDAPTFTKGADVTVAEDSGPQTVANWATAVSAGPPDESGQPLSFAVTGNTFPALFSAAPAVSPSGALTFASAPNANGSATITVVLKDNGGTANGGQDTSAAQTFKITVTAVNDPPVAVDQTITTQEDFSRVVTLTASDVDGDQLTFSVVSAPSHGTLSGSGALLTYKPAADFNGSDSFTFKATDPSGADSAPATVSINVTAVNDPPVNTVPGAQATDQNAPLVFSAANSNAVSVSDVDAGADPVKVTLTSTHGTLTLGSTAGLAFTAGDGNDDATMTFAAPVAAVNAALAGLTFKPQAGFSGSATLQITTNDQGSSGAGGERSTFSQVFITVRAGTVEFTQSSYSVSEGAGSLAVTVHRTGDTSQAATVDYATDDGSVTSVAVPCSATTGIALDRCDFTKALGRLSFAPGEAEKSFSVLITDDSYAEGTETALLRLSNPVSATPLVLGSRVTATMEITDNDGAPSSANPADDTSFFVRQHYHDFLSREPDDSGLQFWTQNIESCGADQNCRAVKRVDTSAAFFLSIEFQETGFLVYKMNKAAFGNLPNKPVPVTLNSFLTDTQRISQGLVVGAPGWEQQLETNKQAFAAEFVARSRFTNLYPAFITPEQYVDALNANAGGVLSQTDRDSLVSDLKNGLKTRAQVLRAVAENPQMTRRESNPAFVLMQYFGYLRRDPDSAPDADFSGYTFWLSKLNQFNGNFRAAEMVRAFVESLEYRARFGR
jgi:CSLREA domain-containing protein